MGKFNWGDDQELPELELTRREKFTKKIKEVPLDTWRKVRWIYAALQVILQYSFLHWPLSKLRNQRRLHDYRREPFCYK